MNHTTDLPQKSLTTNAPVAISIVDRGGSRRLEGPGISLAFERIDGRWRHSLRATDPDRGSDLVLARSIEWDADRDDPGRVASPVFQELQFHVDPAGVSQALLLGMSGRHHFSAAMAMVVTELGVEIRVAAADRYRGEVLAVGSTYVILFEPADLVSADEARVAWANSGLSLTMIADVATRLAIAEAGPSATQAQALSASGSAIPTRVWNYTLTARLLPEQTLA